MEYIEFYFTKLLRYLVHVVSESSSLHGHYADGYMYYGIPMVYCHGRATRSDFELTPDNRSLSLFR